MQKKIENLKNDHQLKDHMCKVNILFLSRDKNRKFCIILTTWPLDNE